MWTRCMGGGHREAVVVTSVEAKGGVGPAGGDHKGLGNVLG